MKKENVKKSSSESFFSIFKWQTRKKDGKFVGHGLVGVCGYGGGRARTKQAKIPENCGFQGFVSAHAIKKVLQTVRQKLPNPTQNIMF